MNLTRVEPCPHYQSSSQYSQSHQYCEMQSFTPQWACSLPFKMSRYVVSGTTRESRTWSYTKI